MKEDTLVADLELSLRTSEWLASLGIDRVGELVARAELALPDDVPPATARAMRLEIEEVLAEQGQVFGGRFIMPPAGAAGPRVTGDIGERWRAIELWLKNHHPAALAQWNPPATPEAIAAAESALGVSLPEEYKAFLLLHNGQSEFAPMVVGALLRVEQLVEARAGINGDEEEVPADRVSKGVRAVDWSTGWIPIAKSGAGRAYLCLDLDPAADGVPGQIIEYRVDSNARPLITLGFADLLSTYLHQVQSGDLALANE